MTTMDGILCPHLEYNVLGAWLQYFTSKVMTFQIFFWYPKDFLENLKNIFSYRNVSELMFKNIETILGRTSKATSA